MNFDENARIILLGGQSNIEWKLKDEVNKDKFDDINNVWLLEAGSRWKKATKENLLEFSALGAYIAKELSNPDRPLYLVSCNKGGTSASCWIPEREMANYPSLNKVFVEDYWKDIENQTGEEEDAAIKAYEKLYIDYQAACAKWQQEHPNGSLSDMKQELGHTPWPGPKGKKDPGRPGGQYQEKFEKVKDIPFTDVIWYQGEEDVKNAPYYKELLETLVTYWRKKLGNLPFHIVQLPGYDDDKTDMWPVVRQAQKEVCEELDNCHLVVGIDGGERFNIHPTNKEKIGHRLALSLQGKLVNPIPVSFKENVIEFDQPITVKENTRGWKQKDEKSVEIPADDKPVYAWKNWPEIFLFSKDDNALAPFDLTK